MVHKRSIALERSVKDKCQALIEYKTFHFSDFAVIEYN